MSNKQKEAICKQINLSINNKITPDLSKKQAAKKAFDWEVTSISWDKVVLTDFVKSRSYCYSKFTNGHRVKDEVEEVYSVVLDFDEGKPTIQEFKDIAARWEFSWFLHTTTSHGKEDQFGNPIDKFRVIVPLSNSVSRDEFEALKNHFLKEIKSKSWVIDSSCFDTSRYFYQSINAETYLHNYNNEVAFLNPTEHIKQKSYYVDNSKAKNSKKPVEKTFTREDDVMLSDKSKVTLKEINSHTPIFCPFCIHDDLHRGNPNNANAFVDFNDSGKMYISCSSEHKTYWEDEEKRLEQMTESYWSLDTSIYQAGLSGDVFSFAKIGEKKMYSQLGIKKKEEQVIVFDHVVNKKHFHSLRRVDTVSNIELDKSRYSIDSIAGLVTVEIAPLPEKVHDNKLIEDYLESVFGMHKDFIKQWLAVYFYTNYRKLPHMILLGERGSGKNTFAESVGKIFPTLSVLVKDLHGSFNPYAEKKLMIIDESDSNGKVQYQELKKLSGQGEIEVNKKYLPQYMTKNNVNVMLLSNENNPIFVEREEMPSDPKNNQFFVYRLTKNYQMFDPSLGDKLQDRFTHYAKTELKDVFENLSLEGYRYSIEVPITEEEKRLFKTSYTDIEMDTDRYIHKLTDLMEEHDFELKNFVEKGYLPSEFFSKYSLFGVKTPQAKIIRDLQDRGFLLGSNADKVQVDGKRKYCYIIGQKWTDEINNNASQYKTVQPQDDKIQRPLFDD